VVKYSLNITESKPFLKCVGFHGRELGNYKIIREDIIVIPLFLKTKNVRKLSNSAH